MALALTIALQSGHLYMFVICLRGVIDATLSLAALLHVPLTLPNHLRVLLGRPLKRLLAVGNPLEVHRGFAKVLFKWSHWI